MPLDEYQRKRDFSKTPEPSGKGKPRARQTRRPEPLYFCVQKHLASRLHYDLRLEHNGALLSWAVPKAPSLDPRDKHMAVQTEDHPYEYGSFEGVIPKGEYGAGTVLLWDRGVWEPIGDPVEGNKRGDLKFRLHGEKLRGDWVLARMGGRAGQDGRKRIERFGNPKRLRREPRVVVGVAVVAHLKDDIGKGCAIDPFDQALEPDRISKIRTACVDDQRAGKRLARPGDLLAGALRRRGRAQQRERRSHAARESPPSFPVTRPGIHAVDTYSRRSDAISKGQPDPTLRTSRSSVLSFRRRIGKGRKCM